MNITIFLNFLFAFFFISSAFAEPQAILENPVKVKAVDSQRLDDGKQEFKLLLDIAKDHLVYVDGLKVQSTLEDQANALFETEAYPVIEFLDKFSNNEIKQGVKNNAELVFTVPYNFDFNSKFSLNYRACTDEFCYLPKTTSFEHGITPVESSDAFKGSILNFSVDFQSSSVLLIFLFVFLAGILTAFTPCIFPMIPITLALIGQDLLENRFVAFKKTCIYVLGIATTYSILGLVAASTGSLFGQVLANPWALIGIGVFYFVMASSMLGLFDINFLSQLQSKVGQNKVQSMGGIYVFGAFTGLFASPCVGPILIGILTYAAQSQNLVFSFFMLFIYALGLGQIFIAISLSGSLLQRLPRSGPWMNFSKYILALLLVAAGLFFLVPGVKSLVNNNSESSAQIAGMIDEALSGDKPVVIDLKADWCAACIEMERITFKDPEVIEALKDFKFLTIDVTQSDTEKSAILKKYRVLGLPTILVFDNTGTWLEQLTVTKYMGPKEMLQLLGKVKSESKETGRDKEVPQKLDAKEAQTN